MHNIDDARGLFGSHGGQVYLHFGKKRRNTVEPDVESTLYCIEFMGGTDQYKAICVQCCSDWDSCCCPDPCPKSGKLTGDHVTGVGIIGTAPFGKSAFVHADSYYNTSNWGSMDCPIIDGIATKLDSSGMRCLIGTAPANQPTWIWNNSFYYADIPDRNCPYMPFPKSGWDTHNCFVSKVSAGSYGFIEGQDYYTYPRGICPYSRS